MKVKLKEDFKPLKSVRIKKDTVLEADYVGEQLMVKYKFGRYYPINHNQVKITEGYEPF